MVAGIKQRTEILPFLKAFAYFRGPYLVPQCKLGKRRIFWLYLKSPYHLQWTANQLDLTYSRCLLSPLTVKEVLEALSAVVHVDALTQRPLEEICQFTLKEGTPTALHNAGCAARLPKRPGIMKSAKKNDTGTFQVGESPISITPYSPKRPNLANLEALDERLNSRKIQPNGLCQKEARRDGPEDKGACAFSSLSPVDQTCQSESGYIFCLPYKAMKSEGEGPGSSQDHGGERAEGGSRSTNMTGGMYVSWQATVVGLVVKKQQS
ncbi:hypothetical protein BDK51DRAFT_30022 [Blyttiomyces helicus]|uniref:Uncharacterized protein n=1 Tax=Blyttiomyces helicus TaxID=388810 RepID=A0A4P9WRF8_9FUNG|nr:hypothetical protein BDK51DRAFT_30022 [Blyttiomyces helicus]|eukprot:RKO93850.1 hypothetical protein BDK51DRAFT_30022 [Blyttiomyces helicus]